jgi:GUN4-like
MSEPHQPREDDVVLGGNNPPVQPPCDGLVLGTLGRRTLNLQQLLQQQQWQAADLETKATLLEISQRQQAGFLRVEDLEKIDCTAWRSIDNLWRNYSNNHFGSSVQARLWQSVGGTSAPDWDAWCRFGLLTGWYTGERWLHWNDVEFSLNAPRGHLPRNGGLMGWGLGDFWVGCEMFSAIVRRLESCQII